MYTARLLTPLFFLGSSLAAPLAADGKDGRLDIRVIDKATGQALAARMHLKNTKGTPVKPPKVPYWKDHFVFDGQIVLELSPGMYTFELESGPEYKWRDGNFLIERDANDSKTVEMERFVDMKKEGWWSGDL